MASDLSLVAGIAERYALALFELARDAGQHDAVGQDLAKISAMIDDSGDLRRVLDSPLLSRAEQTAAVGAVVAQAGANPLTQKFVGVLGANRRLFSLKGVAAAYRRLLAAHKGEVAASVTSAVPLTPEQLSRITAQLRKVVGRDVALESKVDAGLIGGVVVRLGSRMFDASLKSQLQSLQLAMKGVG